MTRKRLPFPVSSRSVLDELLAGLGLKGPLSRHNLINLWPQLVDAGIARHAQALKVVGSVLHVAVDNSVWMHELSVNKRMLLDKLNERMEPGTPPLTDIRFFQRSWAAKKRPEQERDVPVPEATEEERRMAAKVLESVEDDSLKNVLQRILEKDRRLKYQRGEKNKTGGETDSSDPEGRR